MYDTNKLSTFICFGCFLLFFQLKNIQTMIPLLRCCQLVYRVFLGLFHTRAETFLIPEGRTQSVELRRMVAAISQPLGRTMQTCLRRTSRHLHTGHPCLLVAWWYHWDDVRNQLHLHLGPQGGPTPTTEKNSA